MNNLLNNKIDTKNSGWKGLSREAKNLIKNLLKPNPECRISFEHALRHPWLYGKFEKPKIESSEEAKQKL